MKTESIEFLNKVKLEIELTKKEVELVKKMNVLNQNDTFQKLIEIRKESKFTPKEFDGELNENLVEWMRWNVFENELPDRSSGSFLTAISDIDNFIVGVFGGDNEQFEEELLEEVERMFRVAIH